MMSTRNCTRLFVEILCLQVLILLPLPVQAVQGHLPWGSASLRTAMRCRGGSTTGMTAKQKDTSSSSNTGTPSVGVLVAGSISSLQSSNLTFLSDACKGSGASCILFDADSSSSAFPATTKAIEPMRHLHLLPKDDAMVESLSLLCGVVVVLVPEDGEEELASLVPALLKGANRRISNSLKKGTLVVVYTGTASHNDTVSWQDQVMQNQLSEFTPHTWDRLEIVTLEQLEQQWDDIINNASFNLANGEDQIFPNLLESVYRSLGGPDNRSSSSSSSPHPFRFTEHTSEESSPQPQRPKQRRHLLEASSTITNDSIIHEVLATAQGQMEELETKMDQIWLNNDENNEQYIPLLEFGDIANNILNTAHDKLSLSMEDVLLVQQVEAVEAVVPVDVRLELLLRIASNIRRLYQQQLESLREYYGKRYESVLDDSSSLNEEQQHQWTEAAAHATEGFRAAAQHAIPTLCRSNGELRDADFEYVQSLQGLIADMMEATRLRQDEQSLAMEEEEEEGDDNAVSQRRPKWIEKVASRAFVLGVNYLQGWLAWQGIKRAAIERDRNMPKFPLF
jgi:hypothetical protein